ncbi:PAS domain S-box protein [Azospirillum soli]|uniref:PAS domain S-box protein n=1 Tax=Azospirillum soli TaxID=1304799 RepID=UPI001AEA644D|nr:PAS domain S-box protein [Azospirillum soli]MBP2313123.1 PAS domain S-box-containing protein [Azospirillum soli]
MSILTRLILLVLIAALPAIGIQAYNEFALRTVGERRAAEEARRLLVLIQDEQQRVVEGVREVLTTIAQAAPLIGTDGARCQPFLDRLRGRLPRSESVLLTDRAGVVLCATAPALVGNRIADRTHVQMALSTGGFAVGDYIVRRSTGHAVLPFALPYGDDAGEMGGAAVLALDVGWLKDYLARKPLPPDTLLVLADRNGVLLARHPDGGGKDGGDGVGKPMPAPMMALLNREAGGVAEVTDLDGTARLLAYSPVRDAPDDLFLAVGLNRDVALADVGTATRRGALLVALELLLILLAAWFGGRVFVLRPVAQLNRVVNRWRAGDYGARIGLPSNGSEIERLAGAFDTMAEELQAREHARQAARAAERRMAAILASSTDALVELDRDGRITFASERAEALFAGNGPLTGRRFADVLPGHAAALFAERFARALERREPEEFEAWIGGPRPWHAVRLFPTGERLAVYVQDVTRRKQDERAIHLAEERYRSVLDTAADAVILVDSDGTIQAFNRAAERIFGYPAEEAVGSSIRALIPAGLGAIDAGNDAVPRDEPQVIDTGREVEGRRKDGTHLPLEMALAEWWDGSDRLFTANLRDITDRKRSQTALQQAKELAERANQAKTRFLAAASHDLRQPVQSLFFFATALSDQLRNHPGRATLDGIQHALEALKRLLDGLLDISKLDAGVVQPAPAVFALRPVLDRLATEYRPQVIRKGLELRVVPTSLYVRSDPVLLERILRNLLENALRYTRQGRILIGVRRAGGHARVVVCDSGIGIPVDRQEEIFEEFTQIANPERDRERGLGLGLAIVRRLCSLLLHPVHVVSKPGRGSSFMVEVPRAEPPRVAATPAGSGMNAVAVPDRQQLVLVIDDEVIILMGLRVMLEGWGYDVIAATSGEEAIRLLEKERRCPDVILADYRLRHGKTGPEALRAIHAHCESPIPSIILTGDTAPERIVEAQRSGFSILHKPVSAHHLRKLVGEAGGR